MQQHVPWEKIHALEEEIKTLKALGKPEPKKKKKTKPKKDPIEGILKGIKFTDEDFEEAKKMWFDEEHLLYQKHKK